MILRHWKRRSRRVMRDEAGATAVEYGLIVGLIAVGIIGSLVSTRGSLVTTYNTIASDLGGSGSSQSGSTAPTGLFANKTVSSRNTSVNALGQTRYQYIYSDGSMGLYTTGADYHGSFYPAFVQLTDAVTNETSTYVPAQSDGVGNSVTSSYSLTTTYADGETKTYTTYQNFDPNGQTATGTQQSYTDGGTTPTSSQVTTAISTFQPTIAQYNAYKANP